MNVLYYALEYDAFSKEEEEEAPSDSEDEPKEPQPHKGVTITRVPLD
jgi:hypothetical protein